MLSNLPKTADELKGKSWADLQPFFDDLERRPLNAKTINDWLADFSGLSDLMGEYGSRAYVATTRDTNDAEADRLYKAYIEQIESQERAADQRLKLLLESGPRCPYVCGRVPFDQNYPGGHLRRVGSRFFFGCFHFADGLVGEAEVDTRDTLVVTEWRQQALPQCLDYV